MANSTQEAIRIAAEGIALLKEEMTSLNKVILDGATKLSSMLSADKSSFKEMNELINKVEVSTKKLNDASEKKIVVDGKIKVTQNELAKTYQALSSQREKAIKEIQRANRARVKEADSIERNKNALKKQKDAVIEMSRPYNKLIAQHKQAKKVLQDVTVAQGKNSLQTKKAQTEYDRLSKKVNQANGATRNFAKGGLRSSARGIKNLLGAFGLIGGFQLFARAIGDTFNRVREFDKSMQNLAGVFRTTREQLKPLEATIIEVAGSSIKTSREVATLAETLATLGKSPEQIQKLLKPVVDLGIGLNATGADAGEFLIQMLNAFGASDDEALKYADTIATIRTSTTLDFQKMRDSFQYIAPISRLLGKDLAYTGAVVGILADNGLKAQQAGRVLGTSLQKLAIKGLTLTQALEQINKAQSEGVKETELLAMANSLLGAEGAKIGIVLARNSKIIEENAQAIRDNGGALDDLVNEQLKSLDAKLLILDASWERLIFSIENGNGAISGFFKNGATLATGFLKTLTDINDTSDGFFDFLIKYTQSFTGVGRMQLNTEAVIKRETEKRISIIDKILEIEKDLGVIEHERNNNKSQYIKINSIELAQMLEKKKLESESETVDLLGKETEVQRTMSVVLEEKKKLQDALNESTAEEARGILNKISILDKELESWEALKNIKVKMPKVEGLDLDLIGIGQEKLTKYQKDFIDFLETLKKTEDVPELMPLSQETQERLEKYKKELGETIVKLSELDDLKNIFSEVTDTFSDMFDIDVSKFDFLFDGLENSVEDWAKLSKELIGSVLDASLQSYEIELQQAQIARDTTLNNDLASEEAKEAAKAQFREEERRINIEKAKQERKNNLIKIAVDTAVGVVSALGDPFKIAAIIALGLTQAAIVSSQPLPKFEKGTQNSPEGMATTDEKGAEIHTDRLGNIKDLGSNKGARNKYLEKGDKIFTADQSKNMLERFDANHLQSAIFDMNMISNGNILSDKAVDRSLLNEVGGLRKDIDKMGLRIQKMASRPISVNNKVELKDNRAY